jgi:hypothetical protein
MLHESIEQMINNVGVVNAHAEHIGHFLGVALNLDVECQDDGVSVTMGEGCYLPIGILYRWCVCGFQQIQTGLLCFVLQHNRGFHDIFLDDRPDSDV